jgi:NAD+ kinase
MGEQPVAGVVGAAPADLPEALADAGVAVTVADPDGGHGGVAADPDLLLPVGEDALLSTLRSAPPTPVLPVDAGGGVRSLPAGSLGDPDTVARIAAGEWTTERHPVLGVRRGSGDWEPAGGSRSGEGGSNGGSVPGGGGPEADPRSSGDRAAGDDGWPADGGAVVRAAADATLVTERPAHISEFAVAADGEAVGTVRSDGVVVATPAGSAGYTRRIDGPVLGPGTGLAVTPIAPFATDPSRWVVGADGVRLRVERDDADVALLADDRIVRTVGPGETVTVGRVDTAVLAVLPACRTRW